MHCFECEIVYIFTQNKTLHFIMGFTIPEIKTPVPPNAGNEIQSICRDVKRISLYIQYKGR